MNAPGARGGAAAPAAGEGTGTWRGAGSGAAPAAARSDALTLLAQAGAWLPGAPLAARAAASHCAVADGLPAGEAPRAPAAACCRRRYDPGAARCRCPARAPGLPARAAGDRTEWGLV